jgi:hypothetical protein
MSCVVTLFLSTYLVIALIFFGFTLNEGIEKKTNWDVVRIAGLLACFFWPGVLLFGIHAVMSLQTERDSSPRIR